jgi:ABC-type transport system involved in Fe-S cluster assembly fused permease/ATPase subunit
VLILLSLYAPLNILGFAYREIRQSFIDMEEMLTSRASPRSPTRPTPDLPPAPWAGRGPGVRACGLPPRRARSAGLEDVSFSAAPGTTALVGPSGLGQDHDRALALRLLDPQEGRC